MFGSSNRAWTFRDVIDNTKAFAKGLFDENFIPDDAVLLKLPK